MLPAAPASAALSVIVGNNRSDMIRDPPRRPVRDGDDEGPAERDVRYVDPKPLVIDLSTLAPDSATRPDGSPMPNFKEAARIIPVMQGRSIVNRCSACPTAPRTSGTNWRTSA